MDDLPKLRYLIGKKGDQKFKRNVPLDIKALAKKGAWVERVKGVSAAEVREQGSLFAIKTDAEVRRLRNQLAQKGTKATEPDEFKLDEVGAKQIALLYFQRQHDKNIAEGSYFASNFDPDYAEILSDASDEYRAAQRSVDGLERFDHFALASLLNEFGYINVAMAKSVEVSGWPKLFEEHPAFQSLGRRLELCDLKLAELRNRALYDGTLPTKLVLEPGFAVSVAQKSTKSTKSTTATAGVVTVRQLVDEFLANKRGEVGPSRFNQFQLPCRVLCEQLGDETKLRSISRPQAREVCDFLPQIPAHASKKFPNSTLAEAARLFASEHGQPANRWIEAQKHLAVINRMFEGARAEGYLEKNWFDGLQIKPPREFRKKHVLKGATYEPFTIEELNRIFDQPIFERARTTSDRSGLDHHYWAPIISLFSGLRMNEILQLERTDLYEDEGHKVFSITDEVKGEYGNHEFSKRLKTRNSVRLVPIHPLLIELGLWDEAKFGSGGRLFPEAKSGGREKPSDKYTKQFARVLKRSGVWVSRRKVFHSFRNTFNDALRAADVPVEIRNEICGWSKQDMMDARYGKGHPIDRLATAVASVGYEGLKLTAHNS